MTRFLTAVATLSVLFVSGSAFADKIGVAAVVTNSVQGSSPPRALGVGNDVFSTEKIRTGESSAAQLLFLDSTSVSLAARSELTLDRFVYDPGRGVGNVVVTTGKGAFRFVTGSQNPTNYSIKTPVATIGVRGTIVDVHNGVYGGVNVTVVTLIEGKVLIRPQNVTLDQPGTSYVIKSDGTVQGPLKGNGQVATFLKDPKLFELPDNRLDLIDVLGSPTGPTGGSRNCNLRFAANC
jgi:ferric-dicitrate binding protein FerR (iron transport regulator)